MRTISMKEIDNNLYIGSYKLSDLKEKYLSPVYVYDEVGIRNKITTFINNFKSDKFKCEIVYATKAFIAPYLLNILKEYNLYCDAIGMTDLEMILYSKFPTNHLIVHGNNKSDEEIKKAIDMDVKYIVCDNVLELKRLDKIAKEKNKVVNTLFRMNPGISAHTHAYIVTSSFSSKFGESIFDQEKLEEIANFYLQSKNVVLKGFHSHVGSQIINPKTFVKEISVMLDFIISFENRFNIKIEALDLGGGFGIKYTDNDISLDLESCLQNIIKKAESIIKKNKLSIKELLIEPGRSIICSDGFTLYNCGGMKSTYNGKNYVFVDGGMCDNIRPALYQAKYEVDIANNIKQEKSILVDVVGKCCESGDIVAKNIRLPKANLDDTIVVYNTGAYCYSMSMSYNGLLKGEVIFVNNDKITEVIKRETVKNALETSVFYEDDINIFDMHSDMLYDLYISKTNNINNRFNNYHLPQIRQSAVKGAVWTMYSPDDFDLFEAVDVAIKEIDFSKITNMNIILGLEGLRNLKEKEDIEKLYNLGFRHAMLTWNEENKYATGVAGTKDRGLTDEGVALLKRMQELGMIIDLAHLNEKSFFEALKVVNKNIIYSHGNIKYLCDHRRNVTLEQMKALKEVDGLLGLTLANNFVSKEKAYQNLNTFLDQVDEAVKVMGITNVGFGFDFMDYLTDFPNSNISDVDNTTKTNRIIAGLKERGYSNDDIKKICYDNFYTRFNSKIYNK